ncbi:hypothetical protein A9Z50_07740 [Aeromonas hydrophila]|nr:hypothetical protein [Aeromonas hydrophila]
MALLSCPELDYVSIGKEKIYWKGEILPGYILYPPVENMIGFLLRFGMNDMLKRCLGQHFSWDSRLTYFPSSIKT